MIERDWLPEAKRRAQERLQQLTPRLKQAHDVDLCIRINGKDERIQADWLKYLFYDSDDDKTERLMNGNP